MSTGGTVCVFLCLVEAISQLLIYEDCYEILALQNIFLPRSTRFFCERNISSVTELGFEL